MQRDMLREVGIDITDSDSYDLAWIGQASFIDKTIPLDESAERGVEFCKKVGGNILLFDGQDSHSLIGSYEVHRRLSILSSLRYLGLMKNTLLRNMDWYKNPTVNGRLYWGEGNYGIDDIDTWVGDHIFLSGTNWLSTVQPHFYDIDTIPKYYDVCGLFGYPLTSGTEHGLEHYKHYNAHRKPCVEVLRSLKNIDVKMLKDGEKLPMDKYMEIMAHSRVVVSPFGYGEMTPRDLQAVCMGSILIKPSIDYLKSEPWIYDEGKMYLGCRHDYSDLEEKIDYALTNFDSLRRDMYDYTFVKYKIQYEDPTRLPAHLHKIFSEHFSGIISYEN